MGGNAETIWAICPKQDIVNYCRDKALKLGFQRTNSNSIWSSDDNKKMMKFLRFLPGEKFGFHF